MHELYLFPFADTIKSGVASVMCSYNRINQTYGCENSKSLNGLLKEELGFQGYVMSDWGAVHSSRETALGGLDMNMPGPLSFSASGNNPPSFWGGNLTMLVQNGTIPEGRLDDMVRRVMTPYFYLGQHQGYPTVDPSTKAVGNAGSNTYQYPLPQPRNAQGDHAGLIRAIGAEGTVLLKNIKNTLPLRKPPSLAIFGNDAPDSTTGLAISYNATIGTLILGGGSGTARAPYVISPLSALMARAEQDGTMIQYVTDNQAIAGGNLGGLYPLPEVCLVFLKTFASEGNDRTLFEADYNSSAVVSQVTNVCNNTVIVTHSAGVNTMPWADNPNVTAIISAHLPGQESGNSIVDILYGIVNPSGKLPYTIARSSSDYNAPILNLTGTSNSYNADAWQSDFSEGLFIDYRHFDNVGIEPQFPFGHGLSYTTFSMQNLTVPSPASKLSVAPPATSQVSPGGNPALWEVVLTPSVSVSNTGDEAGATVVQLYLSLPPNSAPSGTPIRVLRQFEKVHLQPGESSTVQLPLRRRDVSFWDVISQDWILPKGTMTISVGFSSRDLKANKTVVLA